jgi:hypothetical protein
MNTDAALESAAHGRTRTFEFLFVRVHPWLSVSVRVAFLSPNMLVGDILRDSRQGGFLRMRARY